MPYIPLHHHNTTEPSGRGHSAGFTRSNSAVLGNYFTASPLSIDGEAGYSGAQAQIVFQNLVLSNVVDDGGVYNGVVYRDFNASNPNPETRATNFADTTAKIADHGNGGGYPSTPWSPNPASPTTLTGGPIAIAHSIPNIPVAPTQFSGGWGRDSNAGPGALNPRDTAAQVHRVGLTRRAFGSSSR
jgi:hypothetical protein